MINLEVQMNEAYKKAIFGYLKKRIPEDDYLAVAIQNPNKSIEGVIAYIKHEAKKQAKDGVACIPDEEVFGWAVHYIMEKSLDYEPKGKAGSTNSEVEPEDITVDEGNDSGELEEKREPVSKAKPEKRNTAVRTQKAEPVKKSIEEQLNDFYSESELFRGL